MKASSDKSSNAKIRPKKSSQELSSDPIDDTNESELRKQLYNLQVQQIELEMQNEALRTAGLTMNSELQSYTERYEFSPTPYLTVGPNSIILSANHAAASLLGTGRNLLYKLRLGVFVSYPELPMFNALLDEAFANSKNQSHETKLLVNDTMLTVILSTSLNQQGTELLVELVDITERKLFHKSLIDNRTKLDVERSQLQALIKAIPDLVWLKDVNGVFLNCNSRVESLFGLKEHVIIGKTDYDFVDKALADSFKLHDKAAMQSDKALQNEEQLTFSDGHTELLETTKTAMFDSGGKVIGVLGIAHNITERKQAEDTLQKSEFLFRSQFDLGNIGIAITLPNKSWLRVNHHIIEMLGYSEQKLQNLTWADLTHHEDLDKDVVKFNKMLSGDIDSYELDKRFIHQDGSIIHTHLTVSCYRNEGEIEFVIASLLDVTKRTQTEEKLRKSEERFTLAMKGSHDGLWDWDLLSGEVLRSPRWKSMLGYPENEIGKDLAEGRQRIHPDDMDRVISHVNEFIEGKISEYNIEFRLQHKEGYYIDVHSRAFGTEDEAGKVVRIVGTHIDISKRKLTETKLAKKDERLRLSLIASKQSWFELDLQTGKAFVSRGCPEMLGYDPAEFEANLQAWQDSLHQDDRNKVMIGFNECLTKGGPVTMEYRRRTKQKGWIWISSTAEISKWDLQKNPLRMTGIHTDISAHKKTEEKLQLAANVFTHTREGIIITDAKGTIIEVNNTFTEINGYSSKEAIGQNPRMLQSGRQSPAFYDEMWKSLLEKSHWKGEIWNRHKNGKVYPEMLNISAVKDIHGQITNYVGLSTDISLMKAQQNQLERNAHIDPLTNLPNRVLLTNRLSQAIMQCGRHNRPLAVVFLDLDGFKTVNDSHGHGVGDELLIALSQRMKNELRGGDTLARFGGDEFVAVLTDLVNVEDCKPLLDRLLVAASAPVTIGDVVLNISASIGVTFYPQDNVDADILLRHADQAMYVAKESGKNRYHIFDTAPAS